MTNTSSIYKPVRNFGNWFAMFVGCMFIAAGLFAAALSIQSIFEKMDSGAFEQEDARHWTKGKAQILTATFDIDERSTGTFYTVKGSYRYEFNGRSYISKRIYFSETIDQDRDFHARNSNILKSHKWEGTMAPILINPDAPDQSVVFNWPKKPSADWGAVITALIFVALGVFSVWLGYSSRKDARQESADLVTHARKPWLANKNWRSPEIKIDDKSGFIFMIGFITAFGGGTLWAASKIIPQSIADKDYAALILLCFPLFTAFIIFLTIRSMRSRKRFQTPSLTLKTYPVALGHNLEAVINIGEQLPEDTVFTIELICEHVFINNSPSNRPRSKDNPIWRSVTTQPLSTQNDRSLSLLKVSIPVPADQPESNAIFFHYTIDWHLNITAKLDGPDYFESFHIPVFDPSLYDFGAAPGHMRRYGTAA